MAGAGYKLFNTGDVLTAAQVNTYLMEQTIMVFANATARDTALSGVLAQGMQCFLKDTNTMQYYSGSAWVTLSTGGDITSVTTAANSGLTGGATSGDVALRINTTAKGSLIAGTGASTLGELTVGANNTVLTADSTTATGLKWAAASSGSMTLLSTTTLSTTTTTVSSISQSYKHLYIEILGIDTSNFNPTIVYGTNSQAVVFNVTQAAAATGVNYYNTGGTVGNAQNYGGSQPVNKAAIWLYDYTDATNRKVGSFNQYWINEGGAPIYFNGQFVTAHTAAMNAFYMTVSTGSYDAGTIKIYGVN